MYFMMQAFDNALDNNRVSIDKAIPMGCNIPRQLKSQRTQEDIIRSHLQKIGLHSPTSIRYAELTPKSLSQVIQRYD
jgi:hypothetical protein